VLAKRPFRRHIEGSRPYIVLGEGVRMINAHPVATMVFWGGLTNWVLGYILVGHHVTSAVRVVVLMTILVGWLATCLRRTGKLALAQDSVRAIRALLAEPATLARIERRGHAAWARRGLARFTGTLLRVRLPEQALIRTAGIPAVAPTGTSGNPPDPGGAR
jgi:hypothetical protein